MTTLCLNTLRRELNDGSTNIFSLKCNLFPQMLSTPMCKYSVLSLFICRPNLPHRLMGTKKKINNLDEYSVIFSIS